MSESNISRADALALARDLIKHETRIRGWWNLTSEQKETLRRVIVLAKAVVQYESDVNRLESIVQDLGMTLNAERDAGKKSMRELGRLGELVAMLLLLRPDSPDFMYSFRVLQARAQATRPEE